MNAAADPARWEADVVLSDGGTVHLRPIRPDDAARFEAFHNSLSPETVYYRFFSPRPRLTPKEIERFTTVDEVDRMNLVALLGDRIIATAQYDRWPGRDEAEVAFTVADEHQGRGLATLMLEHLAAIARLHGITRFTAETLPDNRRMLGVFRHAGFEVHSAFSSGIIDVVIDISPTAEAIETIERREQRAESRSIARLMRSRTIAVIGASSRAGSVGHALMRNLLGGGFDGTIYPINPNVPTALGVRTYPSVLDVPDDVHLALVAVPAAEVQRVVEECAAKHVRGVVVLSTGFAELGPEGERAERELAAFARGHGMRLLGPASMGVIVAGPLGTVNATFSSVPVRPGRVAMSSQSGTLGAAALEQAYRMGLGFSTFVSLGNKADLSGNDFLQYWHDDPATDVVLMYTQSYGNPRKFGRVARRVSRRKPVVSVKAPTHDQAHVDALFAQAGVIRVDTVAELLDAALVLCTQPLPAGRRTAVVTNSASAGVLAADALAGAGLVPSQLSVDARMELQRELPHGASVSEAGVDLTHRGVPADYARVLLVVLDDAGADAVMVIYAPPILADPAGVLDVIRAESGVHGAKPVVVVALGHSHDPSATRADGVPVFPFPEPAAAVLGRIASYAEWRARPEGKVPTFEGIDLERARSIVEHALDVRPGGTLLPLSVTADLLATHGIPFAAARAVTSVEAAVAAADAIGYPVTVKAAGIARIARSESGGVALDLQSAEEVRGAYERMRAALGKGMAEAVVQRMVPAGVETIATVSADPIFGPVVAFGLGGAFADAIADRPARSVPLTDVDAHELVRSSRAFAALEATGADIGALEEVLARLALLVDEVPEIDRIRLNPILVSAHGAWAVDAEVHVVPAKALVDVPLRRLG